MWQTCDEWMRESDQVKASQDLTQLICFSKSTPLMPCRRGRWVPMAARNVPFMNMEILDMVLSINPSPYEKILGIRLQIGRPRHRMRRRASV